VLTHERLIHMLAYDPETGVFTWRIKPGDRIAVGAVAANRHKKHGYVRIGIDGGRYAAHRLAWFYMTGEWPKEEIDHRNGTRDDNRWENLREAPGSINNQNQRKPRSDNTTGLLGVCPSGLPSKPFAAFIKYGGKVRNLGRYVTAIDAHQAYVNAKREHHPGGTI
jgi:hypothetical protein